MAISKFGKRRESWTIAGVCALLVLFCAQAFGAESVRDELVRRQQDTGLAFVWLDRDGFAKAIDFATGSFTSPKNISGSEFAPIDFDLGMFGPWRIDYCWSHDRQNIFGVQSTTDSRALVVVNRRSKEVRTVASKLSYPHVPPQCWSRDDRQLVYEVAGQIDIFDTASGTSHLLIGGTQPSWSPDGAWISFLDHGSYYAIRPDGKDRKQLFHKAVPNRPCIGRRIVDLSSTSNSWAC